MTTDTITTIGSSVIQHGRLNDRIYLMKLSREDASSLVPHLDDLASDRGYSKIFAKVPAFTVREFLAAGYRIEARVPGFFHGVEDGVFLGKYFHEDRRDSADPEIGQVVADALAHAGDSGSKSSCPKWHITRAGPGDAKYLAALYGQVFETYPFPITDPRYIRETMADSVRYFIVEHEGTVIAASSAEMDPQAMNAEMTDLAVLPAYRGQGISSCLLRHMEGAMKEAGIRTAYTIARAAYPPVNLLFARAGYRFGGTLVNNTSICGSFESMNVWYKTLSAISSPRDHGR
ncbi:hypothetical protein AZH53_00195 [Methanomicrobiaceae archaeon CYW5]|nr:hypothetical protein [Methanovulcanius yangii]